MWNYFSTILFIREVLTFLLKFYRTISIKYKLQSNISILNSIAHGFFSIDTSEMITDLIIQENENGYILNTKSQQVKMIIS